MKQIQIADGKYTFVLDERDQIEDVLRLGEPWVQGKIAFKFNKCVNAMLNELVELREFKSRAESEEYDRQMSQHD